MTKQEYEAAIQSLDMELYASWLPDEGEKIAEKRHELKEQYIAFLEADNAKLNRALDVLCELLVHHEVSDCPVLSCLQEKSAKCNNCKITVNAIPCWREYALSEAEEEKP